MDYKISNKVGIILGPQFYGMILPMMKNKKINSRIINIGFDWRIYIYL